MFELNMIKYLKIIDVKIIQKNIDPFWLNYPFYNFLATYLLFFTLLLTVL